MEGTTRYVVNDRTLSQINAYNPQIPFCIMTDTDKQIYKEKLKEELENPFITDEERKILNVKLQEATERGLNEEVSLKELSEYFEDDKVREETERIKKYFKETSKLTK